MRKACSACQYDAELAQKIIDQMFVFQNLLDLEDRAIQMVLKEVESETLIIALKGAPPALRQKFLANMSRARPNCSPRISTRAARCACPTSRRSSAILQIVRNGRSGAIAIGGKAEDAYV